MDGFLLDRLVLERQAPARSCSGCQIFPGREYPSLALTSTDFQPSALWKSISQMYAEERNGSEYKDMIQQEAGMEKLH